jgi:hypothetical protein
MNKERLIDWPYVIGLLALPVILLGIAFLIAAISGLTKYDPTFFQEPFLERYATPGEVARQLEVAIHNGDAALLQELRGTRSAPRNFEAQPSVILTILLETDEKYFHYLFFDTSNYRRQMEYIKELDGRYVVANQDLHFHFDIGWWRGVAGPIAIVWWLLVLTFTLVVYVYRRTAVMRQDMYG